MSILEDRREVIAHVIRNVAAGAEPAKAGEALLGALAGGRGRGEARLYFLDLAKGRYELFSTSEPGSSPPSFLSPEKAGVSATDLEASPADAKRVATGPDVYRLPVVREKTQIGVVDLVASPVAEEIVSSVASLDVLSAVFVWIYEQRYASRLLSGIQKPIPYDHSEDWFLSDLLSLIRDSSGMAYAAVRELTPEGDLRCLVVRGFGEESSQDALRERLSFSDIEQKYPAFAEAMATGKPVAELDMGSERNAFLTDHPTLKDVQSYVVAPIKVGSEVFGTLSLATSVRFPFTPFELNGFESIANGVGIAITNFRNHHNMTERFGDIAVGVTALEIATAVRHGTGNILDRCGHYLSKVEEEVVKPSADAAAAMRELSTELSLLGNELEKFKVATERPVREEEIVSFREQWDYASSALSGRMTNLGINSVYEGPDLQILGFGDWIGHLFLNLMLNSMDAFEHMTKKRGREIRLRVSRPKADEDIKLVYSDNATGIVGNRLAGGAKYASDLPVRQRIFEPHVTSKRDDTAGYRPKPGAGLGLFLVRTIMDDHDGSIDLIDSHEGTMFRMLFPRRLLEEN
jgi:hypothetical protein